MNPVLQYWYFHLPNFILAAVMYTAMGRLVLSLFVAPEWKNYIWRALVRVTDPAVGLVRAVTPAGVPDGVILVFTVIWLMLLRVALFAVLGGVGLLPSVAGPP
jgi:YggT family protein